MLLLPAFASFAQEPEEHLSLDEVRTQSGVDPTRIISKIGFSTWYFDKEAGNAQVNNRISATFGVDDWAFNVRMDLVSINNVPGRRGFVTGAGNMKVNILNSFYNNGRHALAASVDLAFPTASQAIDAAAGLNGYFYLTPALTYSYTINQGLMVAAQPQYSFALAKGEADYPAMSLLTVRMFIAKFWDSGLFAVFEPRPMYDFTRDRFDLILSPIVGKALGGASGGYTAARQEIIDLLRQRSRPYLFSNTLAPAICAASLKVFDMLTESTALRDRVHENTAYFRAELGKLGFDVPESTHPIVPVMLYDAKIAQEFAARMLEKGVYVVGFSYPVVPMNKARIRTQVSAGHSKEDLNFAVRCFAEVKHEMGL